VCDGSGLLLFCARDEEFKQISEADLLQYLKDGWQIVKELSIGEVIVRR